MSHLLKNGPSNCAPSGCSPLSVKVVAIPPVTGEFRGEILLHAGATGELVAYQIPVIGEVRRSVAAIPARVYINFKPEQVIKFTIILTADEPAHPLEAEADTGSEGFEDFEVSKRPLDDSRIAFDIKTRNPLDGTRIASITFRTNNSRSETVIVPVTLNALPE